MNTPSILFIEVKDNLTKLEKIIEIAHKHYKKNEPVLISVPNSEAAIYLDQLLWRSPEESFLPHSVTDKPSPDPLIITYTHSNPNHAKILINLCSTHSPISLQFTLIYELLDKTHPDKESNSLLRKSFYQESGCSVSVIR